MNENTKRAVDSTQRGTFRHPIFYETMALDIFVFTLDICSLSCKHAMLEFFNIYSDQIMDFIVNFDIRKYPVISLEFLKQEFTEKCQEKLEDEDFIVVRAKYSAIFSKYISCIGSISKYIQKCIPSLLSSSQIIGIILRFVSQTTTFFETLFEVSRSFDKRSVCSG